MGSSSSKSRRRLIVGILVLAVISTGLYLNRRTLLSSLAQSLLQRVGLEQTEFTLGELGLHKIELENLSGCLPPELLSTKYCLSARGMQLQFVSNVLFSRTVRELRIESLSVELPRSTATETPMVVSDLVKQIQLPRLPEWLRSIVVTGTVTGAKGSRAEQVEFSLQYQCRSGECRYDLQSQFPESGFSLESSGAETADKILECSASVMRQKEMLGQLKFSRRGDRADLGLEGVVYRGALRELGVPAGAGDLKQVRFSSTLQYYESATAEIRYPVRILVDGYKIPNGPLIDIDTRGQIVDAWPGVACFLSLSGQANVQGFSDIVKIDQAEFFPGSRVTLRLSANSSLKNLGKLARDLYGLRLFKRIPDGTVSIKYTFNEQDPGIGKEFSGFGNVEVTNIGGEAGGFVVQGGKSALKFSHAGNRFLINNMILSANSLNAGVELKEPQIHLKELIVNTGKQPPEVSFTFTKGKNFASIFGGKIFVNQRGAGKLFKDSRWDMELSGIELTKLAEIYGSEAIVITGVVDGKLPLSLESNGVSVAGGLLESRHGGGRIQLGRSMVERLGSTPGMELAAKALKDYRYSSLAASVNYQPDGQLLLKVSLRGNSPELNTTRPVNVNLNIEQNLLKLLKSLRIVQQVEQGVRSKN